MPDTEHAVICVPRAIRAQIRIRAKDKTNVWHTVKDPFGKDVPAIDNIPIALVEQIKGSPTTGYEATVT
jgi:hypothetical protein